MPEVVLKVVPPAPASPARQALAELIKRAAELRRKVDEISAPHDRIDALLEEERQATAAVDKLRAEIEAEAAQWLACDGAQKPADRTAALSAALVRLSAANASANAARKAQADQDETKRDLNDEHRNIIKEISEARIRVAVEEFEIAAAAATAARDAAAAADANAYGLICALQQIADRVDRQGVDEGLGRNVAGSGHWYVAIEALKARANALMSPDASVEQVDQRTQAWSQMLHKLQQDAGAEVGTNA